jgi:hypothetical protein
MPLPSHDVLVKPLVKAVAEHECLYAQRVLDVDTRRSYGIAAYQLVSFADQVIALHQDGSCPPTHIDGSPTKAWSDLVRDTRI